MLPPEAVAQEAPPPTVANAGPVPSRPLALPAEVVAENPGDPAPVDTSRVAPVSRAMPPRPSVIVPPDDAPTSVWPAETTVPPAMGCVIDMDVFATSASVPPRRFRLPPAPSFTSGLVG